MVGMRLARGTGIIMNRYMKPGRNVSVGRGWIKVRSMSREHCRDRANGTQWGELRNDRNDDKCQD